MKKLVTIVLSLVLLLSIAMLVACNSGTDTDLTTTSSSYSDKDSETSDSFMEDASSDISKLEESMSGNVELTTTGSSDESSTSDARTTTAE